MNKIRFVVMVMSGVVISLPAHAGIVTTLPEPDAEGWYEFGDPAFTVSSTLANRNTSTDIKYMVYPKWGEMSIPSGAKVRLVGGIVMDAGLTADATIDMSGAKNVIMINQGAFGSRTISVPSGCRFKASFNPVTESAGVLSQANSVNTATVTNDVAMNGTLIVADFGGTWKQTYSGTFSGTGKIHVSKEWGGTVTFTGPDFAFAGTTDIGTTALGAAVRIQTAAISGSLSTVYLAHTDTRYYGDSSYAAQRLVFAPPSEEAGATPGEFSIASLDGTGSVYWDASGNRFRRSGAVCVWGGNTVHIGTLNSAMNFIGEYNLNRQSARSGWGMGNVIVDTITQSKNMSLSTNVNFSVGLVPLDGATFNYTGETNAVNVSTLTLAAKIAGRASSNCVVKAGDVLLLPSKMRGMLGQVQLVDTREGRTYDMSVDFSKDVVCEAGCDGTGYLVQAPATGTIAIRIPTGDGDPVPDKGRYPIFVLDDTCGLLDGWTATVNGNASGECISFSQKRKYVVVRDKRGFWLDVSKYSGFVLSYR